MRRALLPVLGLLLIAASPADRTPTHVRHPPSNSLQNPAERVLLPVPPLPPAAISREQEAERPAPVPNLDATPPVDPEASKPHTELIPSLFARPDRRSGDGYVPGSASAYDPDRRWHAAPSLTVKVPIQ